MKAAIFDFDGTLFESASYWETVIDQYLTERNIVPPDNILSIAKPLGIKGTAAMFKEKFSLEENQEDIAADWRTQMGKNYHDIIPVKENACEYINQLRSDAVQICLATAMERDFVMPALERTDLIKMFDLIVTIADVNADKNSSRIFEYCAEQFQVPFSECTVFEDSVQAAEICKKAGFKVIGVFDGVCINDCELMKPVCDQFIFSFKELL